MRRDKKEVWVQMNTVHMSETKRKLWEQLNNQVRSWNNDRDELILKLQLIEKCIDETQALANELIGLPIRK